MSKAAKHITFIGRVQAVGFRYTARRIALGHQIEGFVKNLPDGSVEMFAQGRPEDLSGCIRDIQESFDGYIRETRCDDVPPNPSYTRFNITF